jgi:hypothetical protein
MTSIKAGTAMVTTLIFVPRMAAIAIVHTSAMRIVVLGTSVPRNVRNEKNATSVAIIRARGTMSRRSRTNTRDVSAFM